ncbi:hypothetical protein [Alienimonas sp. DA493]|uniref:hypothetical protein n=1 Tax=Alienimonas sp. DA493 TaxID=3373605 RepID=UPI0037543619
MLRSHGKLLALAGLAVTFVTADVAAAGLTGAARLSPGVGFHNRTGSSYQAGRQFVPRAYATPQYYAAPQATVPFLGSIATRPATPAPAVAAQPRALTQPRVVRTQPGRVIYRAPAYHVPAAPAPQTAAAPVAPQR